VCGLPRRVLFTKVAYICTGYVLKTAGGSVKRSDPPELVEGLVMANAGGFAFEVVTYMS